MMWSHLTVRLPLLALVVICSFKTLAESEASSDPFEKYNRVMWDFNYDYLDKYLLRPAAVGYRYYLPDAVQTGTYNLILNLDEPSSVVNNLLQAKPKWALNATGRFLVNSTIGVLGVFDVASHWGMPRKQDTFQEVVGYYGVPAGPYIMAPVLGPYVAREVVFDWVDQLYFPYSEFTFWQLALRWAIKGVHSRAMSLEQDALLQSSLDPYLFVREAYYQHINYKVTDGQVDVSATDDEIMDEFLDELE